MAEMRTEEEQVQAIKDWWKNNGSSLLIGVGAALAIVFGWQAWQNQQIQYRTQAANQFAELMNAYTSQDGEERSETVAFIAGKLKEDYSDSAYAVYGSLILAKQQLMNNDDAAAAIETLTWANGQVEASSPLALIIQQRLATAQFDSEQYDEALKTIEAAKNADSFDAIFAELKGDILLAKGDSKAAKEAYLKARELSQQGRSGVLELKLADLGVGEEA